MKTHNTLKLAVAALALAFVGKVSAQAPASASSTQKTESKAPDLGSMNVSICYETFSLPIAKAGALQRKRMTDAELYKEAVNTGKLERMLVLRTKSGQRAFLENMSNYIFPTEFTQPKLIQHPVPPPEPVPLPVAPTAFDKKVAGDTLEGDATLSQDAKSADLKFEVVRVALVKREKWGGGIAELEQPQFETQKLNTNFTVSVGSPHLIGTMNPVFGNGLSTHSEQNVWFCFITTTIVQDEAAAPAKTRK